MHVYIIPSGLHFLLRIGPTYFALDARQGFLLLRYCKRGNALHLLGIVVVLLDLYVIFDLLLALFMCSLCAEHFNKTKKDGEQRVTAAEDYENTAKAVKHTASSVIKSQRRLLDLAHSRNHANNDSSLVILELNRITAI